MRKYTIRYVDGYDLKYKTFETAAETEDEAISKLWESYKNGDFDHQIISIESEEVQTIRALPVQIYEAKDKVNCSNHGISEKFKEILLICDDGPVEVVGDEENLCRLSIYGTYKRVMPVRAPEGVGWMDGGAIVYSHDSRFPSEYPLKLYDRQESFEEYQMLSM